MKAAIEEIERGAGIAGAGPADFMVNRVLEVADNGRCELFGHP